MGGKTLAGLREALVGEHEWLRTGVSSVELELIAGNDRLVRRDGLLLLTARGAEIAGMDRLLGPILRDLDAWGAERERALYLTHARQTAELDRILVLLRDPGVAIVPALSAYLVTLGLELSAEEAEFLSPDLLRDDQIVIDSFGG